MKMEMVSARKFKYFQIIINFPSGLLSYKEFIAIMKDRLHRGLKVSSKFFVDSYIDENEAYVEGFNLISLLRSRACRKIHGYLVASSRGAL